MSYEPPSKSSLLEQSSGMPSTVSYGWFRIMPARSYPERIITTWDLFAEAAKVRGEAKAFCGECNEPADTSVSPPKRACGHTSERLTYVIQHSADGYTEAELRHALSRLKAGGR